jgi:hypothetical protein
MIHVNANEENFVKTYNFMFISFFEVNLDNFRNFSFENKIIHLIILNYSMQIKNIADRKVLLVINLLYQIIFLFYHCQL